MSPEGRLAFVLAALGLSGLLMTAVLWGVPHVEDDLETRAEAAIVDGGFEDIGVSVEGRDLTLVGRSEREVEPQLRAALADVDGVRTITARISRLARSSEGQGG